ncbi:hypothetical protein CLAFUW4_13150 [Fulvia fulva]|uniref:F-box domain-containing protein n=1 Tax=Passalora fulva TaxID=5499 RepID=A0A9Q8PK30_PASFU|nr:uncharacterized protein CLAFUR5_13008 [Fulvia fulva]KAK4611612.1 hypothetical protein CLAFUR4_13155 [Fulvia fulva]UJO23976.1 hypothetical protein CLAFUR5_13008 [Fulvia fulva]WPV21324.1 hypothetical protein CLAFUW4_13150 [Fulvia fulva]WPV36067.1 hypothetical protein CLAFUW7_13158 [Fulvia fulva]
METALPSMSASAVVAGPSSEVSTPAAYEEDARHGHFAITASQVPKPVGFGVAGSSAGLASSSSGAGLLSPPADRMSPTPHNHSASPGASPELVVRDVKSIGARSHEDCYETDLPSPRLRSSRMFKGKGKDAVAVHREEKKPLQLLDLPLDILKDIVKEVTHTNDLTSLALCHSALHRLTTPHIYSRFDIVWPDSSTHAEPRSGVDALTYGLATLVMAEDAFGEAPWQRKLRTQKEQEANNRFAPGRHGRATETQVRRRRGNHYAHFTRKFSLGNGPADWVQEYLITKEGGKMLGTLVALAVARMRTLETFVWDMPTGILRDVWLALSSLGDRDDEIPCKLEKVWVRWHDNSSSEAIHSMPPPVPPPPVNLNHGPYIAPPTTRLVQTIHPAALDRVEHPSFSILPPLKSLSVLDIDELAYLDEMAVLIGRSLDKLRELRIGIARHAMTKDWVTVWEGDTVQQVDPDYPTVGSLTIGEKRLGGVLGVLTGFVCDVRKPRVVLPDRTRLRRSSSRTQQDAQLQTTAPVANMQQPSDAPAMSVVNSGPDAGDLREAIEAGVFEDPATASEIAATLNIVSHGTSDVPSFQDVIPELPNHQPDWNILNPLATDHSAAGLTDPDSRPAIDRPSLDREALIPPQDSLPDTISHIETPEPVVFASQEREADVPQDDYVADRAHYLDNVLRLDSLELERVPISVPVLQKAIDWTRLTSLTLLHCPNHEQLWKTLRKTFAPTPKSPMYPQARRAVNITPKKNSKSALAAAESDFVYGLNLKKIHTNTVSPALISFLKETLAPNSLEVLFLQEARSYSSSVTVDAIYRGPLRRHRGSLKKVLIDSSEKGADGLPTNSSRWRRWLLTREILGFVCSGKMPALRELGMAIDYRDWHFFLQHIPSIPHLRSLYLPFLADHVHGANLDPRELALQIVDIVALRSEVELCYMGIANKCFEILENRAGESRTESSLGVHPSMDPDAASDDGDDDDGDDDEEDDDEDEVEEEVETESEDEEIEEESDDEDGVDGRAVGRLRLREILFYDDKVAIFKGRHGRL